MKNYYYLNADKQPVGPLQYEVVKQLHEAGTLQDSTLAAAEGETQWLPLSELIQQRPVDAPLLPSVPSPALNPSFVPKPVPILRREQGLTWTLLLVTIGIYGIYLVATYSPQISGLTKRRRMEFAAVIVLSIVTLGIFAGVYQIILSYDLQAHSQRLQTPGRNDSLAGTVLTMNILSFVIAFASGGLAFIISVALYAHSVWILQKELNLYATESA